MRQKLYTLLAYSTLMLVVALGVTALVHEVVILWPADVQKAAEWTGAIGTVGTLIGTIWLATAQTRRRDRDELLRAKLAGVGQMFRLAHAIRDITEVRNTLQTLAICDLGGSHLMNCISKLSAIPLWTADELVPMIPLPGSTAARLAATGDQMNAVIRKVNEAAMHNSDVRMRLVDQSARMLTQCISHLNAAKSQCDHIFVDLTVEQY